MEEEKLDYSIYGHDMQVVEISLKPNETVVAEPGALNWLEDEVEFKTKMGDGSESGFFGKIIGAVKRSMAGESIFLTHFTNRSTVKRKIAFAAPYPGKVIPVDLNNIGGTLFCQKDAFLCAAYGIKIDIAFVKRLEAGFFGGEGFILEKIEGNGLVFIHAGGTVVEKKISGTLKVDAGCLVAFTDDIDYSIETIKSLSSMAFGGEGCFLATLRGEGKVFLQSIPFARLVDRIIQISGLESRKRL